MYSKKSNNLEEGIDYIINDKGLLVWTKEYLEKRGYCCKNGCKNCPYGFNKKIVKK